MASILDLLLNLFRLALAQWKIAIALLFIILFAIQTHRIESFKDKYTAEVKEFNQYKIDQEQKLKQSQIDAQQKTIAMQKQKDDAELKYNEDIKTLQADNDRLGDSVSRLSKQLSTANSKLSRATKEAIIKYSSTQSDVLTRCTTEYRNMAQNADTERAERLRLENIYKEASD
jgi:hypothetical protein